MADKSIKLSYYFLAGSLIAIVMFYLGSHFKKRASNSEALAQIPIEDSISKTNHFDPNHRQTIATLDEKNSQVKMRAPTNSIEPSRVEDSPIDEGQINEKFASILNETAKCLEFKSEGLESSLSPTEENLLGAIKPSFGDSVYKVENWQETRIKTSSGEERSIRIEVEANEEGLEQRHLLYSTIGAKGQQTPIGIPIEQSENPSEAIIATLEKDGEIQKRSVSKTIVFENGEELSFKDTNGKLTEMELSRLGKTIHCESIEIGQPKCRCVK